MRLLRACLVLLVCWVVVSCNTTRPQHPDRKLSIRTVNTAPLWHQSSLKREEVTPMPPTPPSTVPVTSPVTTTNVLLPPAPQQSATTGQSSVGDYHSWSDWPLWQALGRCEEPGAGIDGILWSNSGPVYVSGFGMARSTFDMDAHAVGLPGWHDGYAPADQIKVARYGHYIRRQFWGCGRLVPGW